jgi:WD40 repeat protein
MLQDLPPDCLRLIIGQLPSASSVSNVATLSRSFHDVVSANDYGVYSDFLSNAFPSIKVTAPWRQTAINLASRGRAWDRRAFLARECWNPDADYKAVNSASKHGFVPVIDSYETASSGNGRTEVMAYSAGGKIMLRRNLADGRKWLEYSSEGFELSTNDIVDLRLLRPHQQSFEDGETILYRRANGEIAQIVCKHDGSQSASCNYAVSGAEADSMDISPNRKPLLAVSKGSRMYVHHVIENDESVQSKDLLRLPEGRHKGADVRSVKFISSNLVATGDQYLASFDIAPIQVFDINAGAAHGGALEPLCTLEIDPSDLKYRGRPPKASKMLPLVDGSGRSGDLLLAGFSDGIVRLYDLRKGGAAAQSYYDPVDDGDIASLVAFGHERFLAGSMQHGCLKIFDFRMNGNQRYVRTELGQTVSPNDRGLNIFVAPQVYERSYQWHPLNTAPTRGFKSTRYRGSIYSLSSPSPSSSTVYVGITNHVVQLDSICTDDALSRSQILDPLIHLNELSSQNLLGLSCYERPRDGFESTDTVLLRRQRSWDEIVRKDKETSQANIAHSDGSEVDSEEGWDVRWKPPANKDRARSLNEEGRDRRTWRFLPRIEHIN